MREVIELQRLARRVSFRPATSADFPLYSRLLSHDDWRFSYGMVMPLNPQEKMDFLNKEYEGLQRLIICKANGGDVGFVHILTTGATAEISGGICPEFINNGYGVCALAKAMIMMRNDPVVRELRITVAKENYRSKRMIKAMGANRVGDSHHRDIFRVEF